MVSMDFVIRLLLNGLSLSVMLILISIGLSVIYGLQRIMNMAHGEFFILGAYTVVWFRIAGLSFWGAIPAAALLVGLMGYVVEKMLMKFLFNKTTAIMLVTWGLGMMIRQGIQIVMGSRPRFVDAPFPGSVLVMGVEYPAYRVFVLVVGSLLIASVLLLFFKTTFGLQTRAAIYNHEMADALGINTTRINSLAFVIGSALAGVAGALLSPLVAVGPLTGLEYLVKVFFAILVGGTGSLVGTVVGGLVVGGGESLLQAFLAPLGASIAIITISIIIVSIRPQGLVSNI